MDEILQSLDEVLANAQGQAQPVASVSYSEAFGIVLQERSHEVVCGATVAEPGQTPGDAVNGVALRSPQLKFPSEDQSSKASGCHKEKVLNEVSAGTTLMAASKLPVYVTESNKAQKKRRRTERGDKPPTTELMCCGWTFNCAKDLRRHKRTTKAHNAPVVARCSCGKGVTRKDAMTSHRQFCRGTTEEPEA
jgi:hypothetical protein